MIECNPGLLFRLLAGSSPIMVDEPGLSRKDDGQTFMDTTEKLSDGGPIG